MLRFNRDAPTLPITTLNEIPTGTVFEGTVEMTRQGSDRYASPTYRSGVWIKTRQDSLRHGVFAVRIAATDGVEGVSVAIACTPVTNYRVLKNPRIEER